MATTIRNARGRLQFVATRTVITATVMGSPDHIHSRQYNPGEQYVIGSYLMPQGLSWKLVNAGKATEDSVAIDTPNTVRLATAIHEFDRDGPETQAYDAITDPRWAAFIAAYHRG